VQQNHRWPRSADHVVNLRLIYVSIAVYKSFHPYDGRIRGCGLAVSSGCRGMEAELSGGPLSKRTCQGGWDAD